MYGTSEPLVGLDLQNFVNLAHLGFRLGQGLPSDANAREALGATLLSWAALISRSATASELTTHRNRAPRRQGSEAPPNQNQNQNRYLHLGAWWRAAFTREEYVALFRVLGAMVEEMLVVRIQRKTDPQTMTGDEGAQNAYNADVDVQRPPTGGEEGSREGEEDQDQDPCMVTVVVRDLGDRLDWEDWWSTQMVGCFPTFSTWNRLVVQVTHAGERARVSFPCFSFFPGFESWVSWWSEHDG